MSRIIINIWDNSIPHTDAMSAVLSVIGFGKISESAGVEHYCWHTSCKNVGNVAGNNLEVSTNRKRNKNSADSFSVYRSRNTKNTAT